MVGQTRGLPIAALVPNIWPVPVKGAPLVSADAVFVLNSGRVRRQLPRVRLRPNVSAATIASAANELLRQPRYREAARRLAWAIADEHRAVDPVTALERVVRNETRRAVAV